MFRVARRVARRPVGVGEGGRDLGGRFREEENDPGADRRLTLTARNNI